MKKFVKNALRKAGYFVLVTAMILCSIPLHAVASDSMKYVKEVIHSGVPEDDSESIGGMSKTGTDTETETETELVTETETEMIPETDTKTDEEIMNKFRFEAEVDSALSKEYFYNSTESRGYVVSVGGTYCFDFGDTNLSEEKKAALLQRYEPRLTLYQVEDGIEKRMDYIPGEWEKSEISITDIITKNMDVKWELGVYEKEGDKAIGELQSGQETVTIPGSISAGIEELKVSNLNNPLVYHSNAEGTNRHFESSVAARAVISFAENEFKGYPDAEIKEELAKYKLVLTMNVPECKNNTEVSYEVLGDNIPKKIESVFAFSDYDPEKRCVAAHAEFTDFPFYVTGNYEWKAAVVKTEAGVELVAAQETNHADIVIPDPISLGISNFKVQDGKKERILEDVGNGRRKFKGYNVPVTMSADVAVNGIGDVSIKEREAEIQNCIDRSGFKLTVPEGFDAEYQDLSHYREALLKGESITFTHMQEFILKGSGEYYFAAGFYVDDQRMGTESECTVTIDKIKPDIKYNASDNSETHNIGDIVTFSLSGKNASEGIGDLKAEYYETDSSGKELGESDKRLVITEIENGTFEVMGTETGTYYVRVHHQGNSIFEDGYSLCKLNIKKAELHSDITVHSTTSGWLFFKKKTLEIKTALTAGNATLFKQNCEDISIEFTAVSEDGLEEEISLGTAELTKADIAGNKAVSSYTVPPKLAHKLKNNVTYTIVAKVKCPDDKTFPFSGTECSYEHLDVKNVTPYIKVQDQEIEYGTSGQKFEFEIYDMFGNQVENVPTDTALRFTYHSDNPQIVTVDADGIIQVHADGLLGVSKPYADITVTVDDANEEDIYNRVTSLPVKVTVTDPVNTSYTLNGTDWDAFQTQGIPVVTDDGKTEYWYRGEITVRRGTGNIYDTIRYRKNKGKWETAPADQGFVIRESEIADYEFYFCFKDNTFTSFNVDGGYKTLRSIGVDMTAPDLGSLLIADRKAEGQSTASMSYFNSKVNMSAYSAGDIKSDVPIDAGTGIAKIYVQYGDSAEWKEIGGLADIDRYAKDYTLTLDQNKVYGTIRIKAVDYMGNQSRIAEYRGAFGTEAIDISGLSQTAIPVCIDMIAPQLKVIPYSVDQTGKKHTYKETWTNERLLYEMKLITEQASGIYQYQYTFVPRGSKFDPSLSSWETVSADEMKVVLGSLMKEKEQGTAFGKFLYPDKKSVKPENTSDAKGYAQMNGTLYFRAESNAGLFTADKSMKDKKQEIRIWQEDIANAQVCADKRKDAGTGWYNIKTGKVKLSLEYPQYQAEKYAPAVGVIYELHTENLSDDTTVTRSFYKGILDEKNGTVVEVSDYKNPDKKASLSKDGVIKINSDSITTLTVYTEDAAGNRSDKAVYKVKADFTAPELRNVVIDGKEQKLHADEQENIIYRTFSKEKVQIKCVVDYGISNEKVLYMKKCKELSDREDLIKADTSKTITMGPSSRGFIYLHAFDGAGNDADAWSDGIVTDDKAPVGAENMDISITAKGANAEEFFNKDFLVGVKVKDSPFKEGYSGLKSVTYTVGTENTNTKSDVSLYQFTAKEPTWFDIMKSASFSVDDILVNAAENESNEAYLSVTATDNSGNTRTTRKIFQIDVTDPVIEVTFDKNLEGQNKYYNEDRTARIMITEKNFDPKLVQFIIKKDGVVTDSLAPSPDSFNTLEGDVHVCDLTFGEDGDYTIALNCTDMADNYTEFEETEEFTIDKTKPLVEVAYDNNTPHKENYYNSERTATITVEEHNFDEKKFEASVTPQVGMSSWTSIGDTHKATLHFNADEHYTFTIHGMDLAGNEMEPFTEEEFYIDAQAPEISISGVADRSANAGDVVPAVSIKDTNFDPDGVKITLRNSKGGEIALDKETGTQEGGYVYKLTNVNGQPDEIYTLAVTGTDMAGNESELSYSFSLNRHGSTYDLSGMAQLVGQVYTKYNSMEDLHVMESNVDQVEGFSIYVTRNGELITASEEGGRPASQNEDIIRYDVDVTGDPSVGYRYDYTIYKENFGQEGIYNIMFYSKDKAGNEVNNTLTEKGAEITFVVDNTAPNVVIEGVETGEFYAEDSKIVNVYVSDNFKLKEAVFDLVDEEGKNIGSYDYMDLAKEEGQVVALALPNHDKKLSLTYRVSDAADNSISTSQSSKEIPAGFMISTNTWLQYINNKAAVAGTVCGAGGVTAAGAGTSALLRRRKFRRKKIK